MNYSWGHQTGLKLSAAQGALRFSGFTQLFQARDLSQSAVLGCYLDLAPGDHQGISLRESERRSARPDAACVKVHPCLTSIKAQTKVANSLVSVSCPVDLNQSPLGTKSSQSRCFTRSKISRHSFNVVPPNPPRWPVLPQHGFTAIVCVLDCHCLQACKRKIQ